MFKSIYHFFHRRFHTRYYGIYRHAKKLFVFDLALMAGAILMLGASLFFFFWKPSLADLIDLNISFGAERIMSGEPIHLTLDYANRTKFKLTPATLSVHLPAGFVVDRNQTPSKYFSEQSVIDLGTLLPGAKGTAEIYGTIWATPNTEERVRAYLSYQPIGENRGAEQKIAAAVIKLPDTVLQAHLTVATTSLPNQAVPFTYTIANTGKNYIAFINVASGNDAKITFDNNESDFSLAPAATRTITGKIISGQNGGELRLETAVRINNILILQKTDTATIATVSAKTDAVVGIIGKAQYIEPGQTLPIHITWKNTGATEIKNALIKIKITPDGAVDKIATARANNISVQDGIGVQNGALIIDKTKRTLLANLTPGTTDEIDLEIKMLPGFHLGQQENANLEITPIVTGEISALSGQIFEQAGQSTKLPITTELKLSAETRYFTPEGDQVGRGILPPRVGETTKYWIFAQAFNTSNEVKNAHFTAVLPPGVTFTGKQSVSIGPKIQLDETTHSATWAYSSLPANSITGLYFEVAVTPGADKIGQSLPLAKNTSFTATDKITGKNFSLTAPDLNNKLPTDDLGYEAGYLVVE